MRDAVAPMWRRVQNNSEMKKHGEMAATAPYGHKVGDGRPPNQAKWQHCQTGPTIFLHIANPTLYTESNLDFLSRLLMLNLAKYE